MNKNFLICLVLLTTAGLTAARADDNIIATVNGVEIPESRLLLYAQGQAITDENRQTLIDNAVTSELISQRAKAEGLDERPEVKEELIIARQSVLGRVYVSRFFEDNEISEETIEAGYEEIKESFAGRKEYQVAHILVEDEEQARALQEELNNNPGTFAEVAEEHSKDPGSAANGGVLGWVSPERLVPEFSAAMQSLAAGEMTSEPVKSDFGWHIIRVDDTRDVEIPPLTDELRGRIRQAELADLLNRHLQELREQADIETE